MLGNNTQRRLDLLMRGYIAAALVASLVAIAAYFRLFGDASDMFLLYSARAAPSTIRTCSAPSWCCRDCWCSSACWTAASSFRSALMLLVMLAALLLSFSRAAWGQFAFSALILMGLTFLTSRSANERVAHRRRCRSPECW